MRHKEAPTLRVAQQIFDIYKRANFNETIFTTGSPNHLSLIKWSPMINRTSKACLFVNIRDDHPN